MTLPARMARRQKGRNPILPMLRRRICAASLSSAGKDLLGQRKEGRCLS